jgi:hypothetical protein
VSWTGSCGFFMCVRVKRTNSDSDRRKGDEDLSSRLALTAPKYRTRGEV